MHALLYQVAPVYRVAPGCVGALVLLCAAASSAYADTETSSPGASAPATAAPASPAPEPSNPPVSSGDAKPFRMSAAALLGASTNGYGVGVGARLGATLSDHVYVGGTALYHFGRSASVPGFSTDSSALQVGAEVGYAILVPPVIVRPYGGLGVVRYFASATSTDKNGVSFTATNNSFSAAVWAGCTVAYRIASTPIGVGADVRVLGPFDGGIGLGFFAMGSITF